MKCCICGKEIKGHGNSAFPAGSGNCCDECNNKVVVPYRLFLNTLEKKDTALLVKQNELILIKPKGDYFTLKELQKAVDGYIEVISNPLPSFLTLVNEEGLLKNLEFNNLYYLLFQQEIVGNAIVVPSRIFEKEE